MKRIVFAAAICLFVLSACKKSSDTSTNEDYSPLTIGSNWTYLINGTSNKLTVTNKDTVALGRTYKVLSNNNGGNQYQAKNGTEYYRLAIIQGVLPNGYDELYLKSDQNVNATWQLNIPLVVSGVAINVTSKYTVTEKGISKTVQGKTYGDVVHIHQDFLSSFGNVGNGEHYYAKGVGLISSNLNISVPGNTSNTTAELVSYEIK